VCTVYTSHTQCIPATQCDCVQYLVVIKINIRDGRLHNILTPNEIGIVLKSHRNQMAREQRVFERDNNIMYYYLRIIFIYVCMILFFFQISTRIRLRDPSADLLQYLRDDARQNAIKHLITKRNNASVSAV